MRILNLYAGLGGNRKLWTGHDVTSVELDPKIAKIYKTLFPEDRLIVGDAHQYLLDHYAEFDFIWSSPPCQTHSRMAKATRHKLTRYVDCKLWQEILFLSDSFNGHWVVENVKSYYKPFIAPTAKMGRNCFWASFEMMEIDVPRPPNFINLCNLKGKRALQDWLGIHYEENIYYGTNHCPAQILRNCVHPDIGLHILNSTP